MTIPVRTNGFNIYLGPSNVDSGYGGLQMKVIKSMLTKHHANIELLNPPVYLQDVHNVPAWYQEFACNPTSNKIRVFDKCLSINYPTQTGALEGQVSTLATMFESERIPKAIIDAINKHEGIVVPCEQNVRAFRESGYVGKISKFSLGNDQEEYHYLTRNWDISEHNPFTFLHIGHINWRKGGDLAMKAFKKIFPSPQKDVRLILKISKQYTPPWVISGMKASDDRIVIVKEHISTKEMLNLYGEAHCYTGCSRGDAWNLLAFQALATGCPAITTNYCGPEEYQHISFPLNYKMEYCKEKVFGEDWGYYGEPDFDHLCELMEYAYKNPEACRTKGIEASNEIKNKYTWDNTAKQLIEVVQASKGE